MVNKVIELSVSTISYLNDVKGGDVSENQDVQRRFCSDNSFINGIAVTVLTGDYLPPVILGEIPLGDGMVQQYIVDAMQRTAALMKIRFGNHKITSAIEDSVIEYQCKKRDDGKVCRDEDGGIIWERKEFDIKNKTFDEFPDELKKKFDNFQLRIVVHQNCTMERISKLIRRYNNHRAMNNAQKAFTYLDLYARKVRNISETGFFKNCMNFSEAEEKKGTYEKLVCESAMTIFHLDNWKKLPKQMNIFLNSNSSDEEFDTVLNYADRIERVCGERFQDVFVPKDIAVWFAVFNKFVEFKVDDKRFADFIYALKTDLHDKNVQGVSYDSLDNESGTKDKKIILSKINTLQTLLGEYLHNSLTEESKSVYEDKTSILEFVKETVEKDADSDDVELYKMSLEDYTVEIDERKKQIVDKNIKSFIALVAYAFNNETDGEIPGWLINYTNNNITYKSNQKENFLHMKEDFDLYLFKKGVAA